MAQRLAGDVERALIARLNRGDSNAMEPLFDAYYASLARWIRTLGVSHQDAEDMAQECFIVLLRKCRASEYEYREDQCVFTYLGAIAKKKAMARGRKKGREVSEADLTPDAPEEQNGGYLEALCEKLIVKAEHANAALSEAELHQAWDQALAQAGEDERELLNLHYLEGMIQQEMARTLGQSVGWVNKALRQAQVKVLLPLVWNDVASSLSESERTLLRMRYRDGMRPKDMAKALGQSVAERLKAAESNFLKRLHPDTERDHDER